MINYLIGDVLECGDIEYIKKPIYIPHIVNSHGKWGAGFVIALSRKWKAPELAYRNARELPLGDVQFEIVEPHIIVANMVAQILGWENGQPPIRYDALIECMKRVEHHAIADGASICAPRFGSGLAGGDWEIIEEFINEVWKDVPVYIFDLPGGK